MSTPLTGKKMGDRVAMGAMPGIIYGLAVRAAKIRQIVNNLNLTDLLSP